LQYLACGLPTIATPLHGLQSMVAEGEGVCYADGAEDMAHKAVQLVSNQQQRGEVASRGLRLIERHCNWETQIQIFEQMLESLISDQ
jgi:glycosyltransferase involved in cell wall biosynthesis